MSDWFDDLESCYDCHCYVSILDEHQQVCIPYQKRIQAERDSQLGASEWNPEWVEPAQNPKLAEAMRVVIEGEKKDENSN